MRAKVQFQLSVSTNTGIFNDFHPMIYQTQALPVLYMVQHADVGEEDAHYFVSQVKYITYLPVVVELVWPFPNPFVNGWW